MRRRRLGMAPLKQSEQVFIQPAHVAGQTVYRILRDLHPRDYRWLKREIKKGEYVYRYRGYTYGCIGYSGVACSFVPDGEFFELPEDALSTVY